MTALASAVPRLRLWRSRRTQRIVVQAVFVAAVALLLIYLYSRATRLDLGLTFLRSPAGFAIANEWIFTYDSNESRFAAYVVGVWNTIRLVTVGIVFATVLGIVAGVARLSGNWLVSRVATLYVETVRNTPLLVQIVFWWLAVFLALPHISEQVNLAEVVFISNRGAALPSIEPRGLIVPWLALVAVAAVIAWLVRRRRARIEDRTGESTRPNTWGLLIFVGLSFVAFFATALPLGLSVPEIVVSGANIHRYEGGVTITPQFAAVLVALATYTGAFIAEIVRGSIQALPVGQAEAAAAGGLSPYQRITLIILPQALRTMIPPLTNQYLNLAKNSSLAIVVGFSELFFVSNVIINNAGHAVPMFLLVILTYQAMSFTISAGMNYLNARVQLVGG